MSEEKYDNTNCEFLYAYDDMKNYESERTFPLSKYKDCEKNNCIFKQLQAAKEENEKLKECFIPLNQKKYYCSKEVYNILEDTKNDWQIVTQLESEGVMEITKLERENKHLTQQNKQMRVAINNIKNLCNEDWEDMTVDKFQNQLLQALKGVE